MRSLPKYILTALLLASLPALAAEIKCPVCGVTFDDDVDTCPNDATDLGLLRKHKKSQPAPTEKPPGDPSREVKQEEKPAEQESKAPSTNKKKADKKKKKKKAVEPVKYQRHDRGGERKRADENSADLYSDRQKRISREAPQDGGEPSKRVDRLEQARAFARRDARRRRRLEESKDRLWQTRFERVYAQNPELRAVRSLEQQPLFEMGPPTTSIGYRFSWMSEKNDPGAVSGAEADLNFYIRKLLRLGFSSFVGVRHLNAGNEMLFLEQLSIGVQVPWRFSPFLLARGGIGALVGEQLDNMYFAGSAGAEAGIDCHINKTLVITPSMGIVYYFANSEIWGSFTGKLAIGF